MSIAKLSTLAGSALALALIAAGPVLAQDSRDEGRSEESNEASGRRTGESVLPGRIGGGREDRQRQQRDRRGNQPAAPTAEEIQATAVAVAAIAAPACQVTEAALLGNRADGVNLYEVACATGPGYIIQAEEAAPTASDCVLQSSLAWQLRQDDPEADVGLQCGLPGNQNRVQVITEYGRQAGVSCDVDEAVALTTRVYELGCAGADGYRLERADTGGWSATACWRYALISDGTCRLTTSEESRTEWPKLVANSEASACIVEDVAWMGDNPERGAFYELKCNSGEGLIVRFLNGQTQQVYTCENAVAIFSKACALTIVPESTEPETAE